MSAAKLVVAAVIMRDNRILICQRREDQGFALQWEFPGGKVEPGEELTFALHRELREELAIDARIGPWIATVLHRYANGLAVELHFFRVDEFDGQIENKIFRQIRWVDRSELDAKSFLEADRQIVRQLKDEKEDLEGAASQP
jgi:8-oxo-dGTP diphosphatase